MNRVWIAVLVVVVVVLFGARAQAVTLTLEPASPTIAVGQSVDVDLTISGLGDLAPPSLGAFSVEITFGDSILTFDSAAYGSFLGDPNDLLETDIITTVGTGVIGLDEFSFLFDFELDALQPSEFTLATLTFIGLAEGTSGLGFGQVDLASASFPSDVIEASLVPASATVTASISEPATLLIFAVGLAGLGVAGRRRRPAA